MKPLKKDTIRLQFDFSIEVPYTYDVGKYDPKRNKKIEKAIMKWITSKNIKNSLTNGDGNIPFYVEKDETGASIEETTEQIKVRLNDIYET